LSSNEYHSLKRYNSKDNRYLHLANTQMNILLFYLHLNTDTHCHKHSKDNRFYNSWRKDSNKGMYLNQHLHWTSYLHRYTMLHILGRLFDQWSIGRRNTSIGLVGVIGRLTILLYLNRCLNGGNKIIGNWLGIPLGNNLHISLSKTLFCISRRLLFIVGILNGIVLSLVLIIHLLITSH
jgi:hypothetical protein